MNAADSTSDDLYANTGDIYLRISGNFYHRVIGKGWISVTPEAVSNITGWSKLHDLQRAAYEPGLRDAGLIS